MSGVLNSIGKVFSRVWDFVRPLAKVVLIAAAIYMTAGIALSYFPATAAFAASMPGFAAGGTLGLGVGEGAVAGTGVFSEAAAGIGLGGGLAGGALEGGSVLGAGAATSADLAEAGFSSATIDAAGGAGGALGAPAVASATTDAAGYTTTGLGSTAAVAPPAASAAASAAGGSSLTDKLLLASIGAQTISGLTAPSPRDIAAAKAGFYGSFYGINSDGSSVAAPNLSVNPQAANPKGSPGSTVTPATQIPGINIPGQTATGLAAGPTGGATAQTTMQSAQTAQLIPTVSYSGQPLPGSTPDFAVQGSTPLSQPKLIPTPTTPT